MRIGVIGVGGWGERHCRVLSSLPDVILVGIVDTNEQRGREVAGRYKTTYYPDYETLLPELDAVTIATPTCSHFEVAKDCLEQDIHVLVEKPITDTSEQAQQLIRIVDERNLIVQVGHIERFNPVYLELKNVLEDMRLVSLTIWRLRPTCPRTDVNVDVVRDLMIHDLDLAVALVGPNIEGISAWGRSIGTEELDHVVANLSFRNGPIVTLFTSRVAEQKVMAMEVIAEGAYIEADLLNKSISIYRQIRHQFTDVKYRQESLIERIYVPPIEPLLLELQHFTNCVREQMPSRVPASDGLRALRLAEAVIGSANDPFYSRDFTPS